ncbi:hypothetical protein [Halorussus caseinilyticus]|uniref:DUF7979 domain-containing protein n=1 Tax=Halorussus caseinilyticus TaxID=3034025 RepID=A0ABD5WPH5_9EURY|nr:hypothetical protein [Halorussus sp. DT72]
MPGVPSRERLTSIPPRKRLPALLLVLAAVALAASSAWVVYDDFRPYYSLTVTQVGATPDDADVLDARNLPTEAEIAFEQARDGGHVVHERPEWLDTFPLYDSVYVRADGTVYELWARSDGLDGISLVLAVPAVALALGLGGVGAWSYRREKVRVPLTILAGLCTALAVSLGWPFPGTLFVAGLGIGPAKTAIFAALAASVGTWRGLGRRSLA